MAEHIIRQPLRTGQQTVYAKCFNSAQSPHGCDSHLLVWLRCLSIRLRGGLHRRVHGGGGIVRGRSVLVPRGEGGVVAQVPTWWSRLGQASCGRKGKRNELIFNQISEKANLFK